MVASHHSRVANLELLPWLLLACPLMMLFVHRGGHSGHRSHVTAHTQSRDDLHTTE